MGLAQLYSRLPPGMVRRRVNQGVTKVCMSMNISTPNLRKLLAMKSLDRDIKCRLYAIYLHRRQNPVTNHKRRIEEVRRAA